MEVTDLSYKPKWGGRGNGFMMLHLEIAGATRPPLTLDFKEVTRRCEEVMTVMQPKVKNVIIDARNVQPDDQEVLSLCVMLRDRGFVLALELDGQSIPMFMREAHVITVYLQGEKWLNFAVSDVVYEPVGELVEPEIGQHNVGAMKYVVLNQKDVSKHISFIQNAQHMWGLMIPPKREIGIDFLGGIDE